jgi:hypothetical protein
VPRRRPRSGPQRRRESGSSSELSISGLADCPPCWEGRCTYANPMIIRPSDIRFMCTTGECGLHCFRPPTETINRRYRSCRAAPQPFTAPAGERARNRYLQRVAACQRRDGVRLRRRDRRRPPVQAGARPARIWHMRGLSSWPSHHATTMAATAAPMKFVNARASDMKRSMPRISAMLAIGMWFTDPSVAASTMKPLPSRAYQGSAGVKGRGRVGRPSHFISKFIGSGKAVSRLVPVVSFPPYLGASAWPGSSECVVR